MNVDTEVFARISEIEGMIEVARAACREPGVPDAVAAGVQRLVDGTQRLRSAHLLGAGEAEVARAVADLEAAARHALELAENSPPAQQAMAATLEDAYGEIRDLRRQVHGT